MVGLCESACHAALNVSAADGVYQYVMAPTLGAQSDHGEKLSTGRNLGTVPELRLSASGRSRRQFWGGTRGKSDTVA
jgi:hypothetical protein